jgi:hypothetical protein
VFFKAEGSPVGTDEKVESQKEGLLQGSEGLTVAAHKPVCQERSILTLNLPGKLEEVAEGFPPAAGSSTVAGPGGSSRDVEIIIARDLLTSSDVPPGNEEAADFLVSDISVRIATVVEVPIRISEEDHFAVRIIAMVHALSLIFPEGRLRSDLPEDIDLSDTLPCGHALESKNAQPLDCGLSNLDILSHDPVQAPSNGSPAFLDAQVSELLEIGQILCRQRDFGCLSFFDIDRKAPADGSLPKAEGASGKPSRASRRC